MTLSLRFAFYFTQHYTSQLIFDEKTNDHFLVKSLVNEGELLYVNEADRRTLEAKLAQYNRSTQKQEAKKTSMISGKFEFERGTGSDMEMDS